MTALEFCIPKSAFLSVFYVKYTFKFGYLTCVHVYIYMYVYSYINTYIHIFFQF